MSILLISDTTANGQLEQELIHRHFTTYQLDCVLIFYRNGGESSTNICMQCMNITEKYI